MNVYDLTDDGKEHDVNDTEHMVITRKRKDKHKYSEHELRELMGTNRDTYKRVRSRVKRR